MGLALRAEVDGEAEGVGPGWRPVRVPLAELRRAVDVSWDVSRRSGCMRRKGSRPNGMSLLQLAQRVKQEDAYERERRRA